MKKIKQPGDNISLKTKKTEDPSVMEWINAQTNLMDSLRYLIEHEIVQNGVRNLQTFIPVERNVLGSVTPPLQPMPPQERVAVTPQPEPAVFVESVQHGAGEVRKGIEEASAGRSVQQLETEPSHSSSLTEDKHHVENQPDEKQPEQPPDPVIERHAEDEIDDEDIEAWV